MLSNLPMDPVVVEVHVQCTDDAPGLPLMHVWASRAAQPCQILFIPQHVLLTFTSAALVYSVTMGNQDSLSEAPLFVDR